MVYTYPDYYKEFKCIADKCEDTCCAGWQIVIDDKSLENYRAVSKENAFKERLEKSIDWNEGVFKQDSCRRCAFLNEKNLCDLYTALGEDSLCYTCHSYPRHTEEYENLREVTLSISCPQVARMLLGNTSKVTFYTEETDEEDDFDDFDVLMHGILQDIRSEMIGIMQDRSKDIAIRGAIIWHMAEDLQKSIDEGDVFGCEDIIENTHKSIETMPQRNYDLALDMFKKLYNLEVLMEDWEQQVDETSLLLYVRDEQYYSTLSAEFDGWLTENMSQWQIQCEQIVVYFLSTYICGAVYDGWLASKVKMSVAAIFYIHEMLMALWIKQEKNLSFEDIVNITYRFSRELEHSDINLDEMESAMNELSWED